MSRKTDVNDCSSVQPGLGYEWVKRKEGRLLMRETHMSKLRISKVLDKIRRT